ncbi:MAG: Holliday junction branch migration protein RuvA [Candidatus Aminicenantales bacterium]
MIAHLKGQLLHKSSNQVVLDIGGVGYCAWIPLSTYLKLGDVQDTVELHVYTHVTDKTLALYGFYSEEERDLFLKLISISGIGPKIALNILSGIEASDLKEAIRQSDVARISLIPGIGKKTAMRIALELQEKLDLKEGVLKPKVSREKEDLVSALMNLGFKRREVEKIVDACIEEFSPQAGLDKLLRESLKRLARV